MDLKDILLSDNIVNSINENLDYLLQIIPEIKDIIGFKHKHPHHHLDVWNHTLLALSLSENNFDIRLSLLLHDIGKPFSYQEGEVRHFKNHNIVSSEMSKNILIRLGYDVNYIDYICYLIKNHDIPISEQQIKDSYEMCLTLYKIQKCDALAHNPYKLEKRIEYLDKTNKLLLNKLKGKI